MKIKRIISDGSMSPKLTYEDDFVNPITGETQTYEMTFSVTRENCERFAKEHGDTDEFLEKIAHEEYETSNARFQYDIIKNYAMNHNHSEVSGYPDVILEQIEDVVSSSGIPKVVLTVNMLSLLRPFLDTHKTEEREPENTSGIFHYCTIDVVGKSVNIFVNPYTSWAERDCLVYDEGNPKNSKLITLTNMTSRHPDVN